MTIIRKYKNGDEGGIVPLFNEVFKSDRKQSYWYWQFMENPAKDPIIILVDDQGRIAGQSTLLPTKINLNGKTIFAGQAIDTMVDKEYRRRGLYQKMAFKSYDIANEEDIKFVFRFPSKPALQAALEKLDSTLVEEIPLYINIVKMDNFILSIVRLKPLAKLLSIPANLFRKIIFKEKKSKTNEDYTFKEVEDFTDDFNKLWDKIKGKFPLMTERKKDFLNWRIKDHPSIDYKTIAAYSGVELVGYIILKVEDRKIRQKFDLKLGSIVDLIGIDDQVVEKLYLRAKDYFRKEDTDFLISWGSENMRYKNILKKMGFYKTKSSVPFVVKELECKKDFESLVTKEKNWYVMPIESDFY